MTRLSLFRELFQVIVVITDDAPVPDRPEPPAAPGFRVELHHKDLGIVTSAEAIPKKVGIARQTPRVSITIKRTALAKRQLGRSELKRFSRWSDTRPETELNFKFYRQATNKIVGLSGETAAFLRGFF